MSKGYKIVRLVPAVNGVPIPGAVPFFFGMIPPSKWKPAPGSEVWKEQQQFRRIAGEAAVKALRHCKDAGNPASWRGWPNNPPKIDDEHVKPE